MPSECLVIAIIIGGLSFSFFRAKRKNWGYAVLPISVIPLTVGLVMYIAETVDAEYSFLLPMGLVVGSLIVSCIWIGISCTVLVKTKKLWLPYLVITVGFCTALSFIILIRYYNELCL